MRGEGYYLEAAACNGADPKLFDAIFGEHVNTALTYCDRCTVITACEEYVRPSKHFYDGVVAGKVWRNGVPEQPALFE
jgi:WhiB family transcriptional regulator, redox-sensing transcriptional regulator